MSPAIHRRPDARRDVVMLAVHIAADNPGAADRFLDALERTFRSLVHMPGMGSLRNFGNPLLSSLRMWPVPGFEKYLVFYRSTEDGIEVVRVLHAARDIASIFEEGRA